jgi:hypothetical protein
MRARDESMIGGQDAHTPVSIAKVVLARFACITPTLAKPRS